MKNLMLLKSAILCMAMMMCGLSLTACGDDDEETLEEQVPATSERETFNATYTVSLSENWYQYFDIEVNYTVEGAVESETIAEMDWTKDISIPASAAPDQFVFSVTAKPKADAPELDPTVEEYEFSHSYSLEVSALNTDGSEESVFIQPAGEETLTFDRAGLEALMKEGVELFSFEKAL